MISLALLSLLVASPVTPPAPSRWVTDEAQLLSDRVRKLIDRRLETNEHATGHEVLVWIGRTTGGEPIEVFAERAFRTWRVGRERLDTGVVLFVFSEDRTVRLEVGSSLSPVLTEAVAARIIDERIAPLLKVGEPDSALSSGVDSLLTQLTGAPIPASPVKDKLSRPQWFTLGVTTLGFVLLVFVARPGLGRQLRAMLFWRRGRRSAGGI